MSSEQPRGGRGSTGSPLGSTAAIIIAIVAVVAGFLILRQINDDDDEASTTPDTEETIGGDSTVAGDTTPGDGGDTTLPGIVTTLPAETTPTTVFTVEGAIVVVANASNVNGAAGQLTTALTGAGFSMAGATDATEDLDASKVFYDPANTLSQAVASSVATSIGVAPGDVLPIASPAPVTGGALQGGATVLVMLGKDKAGKTLEQMVSGGTATATTVAGATATTTATADASTTTAG
jgi:hypothetical protein